MEGLSGLILLPSWKKGAEEVVRLASGFLSLSHAKTVYLRRKVHQTSPLWLFLRCFLHKDKEATAQTMDWAEEKEQRAKRSALSCFTIQEARSPWLSHGALASCFLVREERQHSGGEDKGGSAAFKGKASSASIKERPKICLLHPLTLSFPADPHFSPFLFRALHLCLEEARRRGQLLLNITLLYRPRSQTYTIQTHTLTLRL